MSFDPRQYPTHAYSGIPTWATSGAGAPSTMSPRCVPLNFNWLVYFTALNGAGNIAIPINLQGGAAQGGLLDKIVCCKIDNTNSTVSISVFFPDTGDIVTCPPECVATLPVTTNGLNLFVIAQGLSNGFTPTTSIFLYNYWLPPSIDPQLQISFPQLRGSPTIQRANALTPGYASPALGDQLSVTHIDLHAPTIPYQIPVANWIAHAGFFYVTTIEMIGNDWAAGTVPIMITLEGSLSGPLVPIKGTANGAGQPFNTLCDLSGMQLRLSAQETWIVDVQSDPPGSSFGPNASMNLFICYTDAPQ